MAIANGSLGPLRRTRNLALYLPQFYPVPENDRWWGPGFTEWINVAAARPLFRGHDQPHLPGELGFYDLRLPEVRAAQAQLAVEHGIEGFIYWHYWFGNGRQILERPFQEVLTSGEPDFPFCLAWANQSWTGVWYGETDRVLLSQQYPGDQDTVDHFRSILPALFDSRYIRVEGKPVFFLFRPQEHPNPRRFSELWRSEADRAGLPGLHLVGMDHGDGWRPNDNGFDASVRIGLNAMFGLRRFAPIVRARRFASRSSWYSNLDSRVFRRPLNVHPYQSVYESLVPADDPGYEWYPCVIPNWDNTPRSGKRGSVLTGSTPALFAEHLRMALDAVAARAPEHRIVVIKSWNEWAEGNYLEPDRRWGRAYLEVIRETQSLSSRRS